MNKKKAEVGIGSLILFIAMVVVAAVIVGVLFQTSETIEYDIRTKSTYAERQVSTSIVPIDLIAIGDGASYFQEFELTLKLGPGSHPLRLNDTILFLNSVSFSDSISFRGINSVIENNNLNGYNTKGVQEFGELEVYEEFVFYNPYLLNNVYNGGINFDLDLDGDGINDQIATCSGNNLCPVSYRPHSIAFNLSQDGEIFIPIYNDSGSLVDFANRDAYEITNQPIYSYGFIKGFRTGSAGADIISSVDPPGGKTVFNVFKNRYVIDDDLDSDGFVDYLAINYSHAFIYLSSIDDGIDTKISIPLDQPLYGATTQDVQANIMYLGTNYGELIINGDTTENGIIPDSAMVRITANETNKGFYSVEFVETDDNSHDGKFLKEGEIIKIGFQASEPIYVTSEGGVTIVPKDGNSYNIDFETPNVIGEEVYTLFP